MFWPEMVIKEEALREKWTEKEISVDHPLRKLESIRDPSIFTAGLTSNIVGLHCDIAVMDDVVVQGNAYLEEGREKVKDQYSLLSSVETANAQEWVVGTRYHPRDLYSDLLGMEIEEYDELGNVSKATPLFEVFERQVESIETELENFFGLSNNEPMESGSDSIPRSWLRKGPNTLTRYTLGPNTTMTLMTLTHQSSNENSSNTTTPATSLEEKDDGSSNVKESM
jgi:hypothetical protein